MQNAIFTSSQYSQPWTEPWWLFVNGYSKQILAQVAHYLCFVPAGFVNEFVTLFACWLVAISSQFDCIWINRHQSTFDLPWRASSPSGACCVIVLSSSSRSTWQSETSQERKPARKKAKEREWVSELNIADTCVYVAYTLCIRQVRDKLCPSMRLRLAMCLDYSLSIIPQRLLNSKDFTNVSPIK